VIFAYADPPYLGCGKLYVSFHNEATDWDRPETHIDLACRLVAEYPDGWVLSCNPRDLRVYLAHLPDDVRDGAWVKTWHQIRPTTTQYAWEAILFRGGRKDHKRTPMVRDWLQANATKQRGLPGAKPDSFNRWVLDILNYRDGDEIHDLFPGTGSLARVTSQGVLL
jgi:hypothetical protein